jgi:putative addiction module component (TIGR02574 family)
MTEAAKKLKSQLESLPEQDREELVDFLLNTLSANEEDEAAWEAELARREAELESGAAREIPADEVFQRLREKRP